MIPPAVRQHCSLHRHVPCLAAAISRQLSACVPLLLGRVGAGADAVTLAMLAASVSCHRRWNAADLQRTVRGCRLVAVTPEAITIHTTHQTISHILNTNHILSNCIWCRALTYRQVAISQLLKVAWIHTLIASIISLFMTNPAPGQLIRWLAVRNDSVTMYR